MSIGKVTEFDPTTDDWTSYTERVKHYLIANNIREGRQKSTFLAICGSTTFELAKTLLQPTTLDEATYAAILEKLTKHYAPKPSPIVQRFKFNTRERQPGESISVYIAALRTIGEHCGFGDSLTDMI